MLPIGSPLPAFDLPGIDGKNHRSSEYASSRLLAVVFESNHCPVSQLYEARIDKLHEEYGRKGVAFVAINPNNPKAVRLDELGYTDVTDSLPEMKLRAQARGISWPYLYDGDTQATSMKFGAVATPHLFIFDHERKLRYQGRIDDNQREELVKVHDARNALDALLARRPVPVRETKTFGCTTKWLSKASGVEQEWARIQKEPVTVGMVGVDELKRMRANPTDKVMLVRFWSTGCADCTRDFFDLETTYRMYRQRAFDLVTISTDPPARVCGRHGVPEEAARIEPEQAVRHQRSRNAAGGMGGEVEPRCAADDGDRARRAAFCTRRKVRSISWKSGGSSWQACPIPAGTSDRKPTG